MFDYNKFYRFEHNKILSLKGSELLFQFNQAYGREGNCSCHIDPPCFSCTHGGNPMNLVEQEDCWMVPEEPWVTNL